jgi:hypothetical protein
MFAQWPPRMGEGDQRGTMTLTDDLQDKIQETDTKAEELTVEQLEQVCGGTYYGTGVYKMTDGGRGG